ncbi:MAG TPA: site-2 protease family protein [Candidatus Portnoybacteria bacterium]|jgi:Zn-dependent protease|nr:site-2 protease family protein [Candidatus Portnoybacteria bacterium]MDD5751958.1 site-2 protease family protein [Candidatus Portnoybacteria bacterium]HPJ80133.1 site-2 protease family protein [Candidatus Portnoybacteria bacterium]
MSSIETKIFIYIIIVFSSIIHEYCHAWAAYVQGDHTAKEMGRLTLNPIPHLDLYGTVIIPLFFLFFVNGFIGWAKPVPINPYNFKNQKTGLVWVSLAGPVSNLFIALILGLLIRFNIFPFLNSPFSFIAYINIFLALFNLIPMPPLDGSKLLLNKFPQLEEKLSKSFIGMFIALAIAITILPYIASFIYVIFAGRGV